MKFIGKLLCMIIGCQSIFARWFEWPHSICDRREGVRKA